MDFTEINKKMEQLNDEKKEQIYDILGIDFYQSKKNDFFKSGIVDILMDECDGNKYETVFDKGVLKSINIIESDGDRNDFKIVSIVELRRIFIEKLDISLTKYNKDKKLKYGAIDTNVDVHSFIDVKIQNEKIDCIINSFFYVFFSKNAYGFTVNKQKYYAYNGEITISEDKFEL